MSAAEAVKELRALRRKVEELIAEMCETVDYRGSCQNKYVGWSAELFNVYKHLEDAKIVLARLERKYMYQLKAEIINSIINEKIKELLGEKP